MLWRKAKWPSQSWESNPVPPQPHPLAGILLGCSSIPCKQLWELSSTNSDQAKLGFLIIFSWLLLPNTLPKHHGENFATTMPKMLKVACSLTATWSHNTVKGLLSLWADKTSRDAGSSYGSGGAFFRGEPPSQSRILCFCWFKSPHSIFCVVLCSIQLCKFINHTLISTQFHKFSNSEKGGF